TSITNATLSSAAVPLPIRLRSFTAQSKPDAVILQWSTGKEENFKGFDIERSVDGRAWNKMAFVATMANNASAITQYSYTDNTPVTGHVYYRLKMLDADGGFTYSKQLSVIKNERNTSLQNYPNPFTRQTNIAFQLPVTGLATLKVFNNMGVEVSTLVNKELEAGNYTVSFDGTSLPAGVYHYTLQYGKEKLSGTMLLK
ncbi:MAG TPA: T9SS type A sorting domain-containing protein, partial [Niastella sp.]